MPRKTLQTSLGVSTSDYGPTVRLVDEEGDPLVNVTEDAVRTYPITLGGGSLFDLQKVMDKQLKVLEALHLGHQLHLWEEEVPIEE